MPDRARLLALAHRLEGKDPVLLVPVDFHMKGSPKLDQEIADALGVPLRPFTESIDAVLTLTSGDEYDFQTGIVNGHLGGTPYGRIGLHESYADTPALALCAATLRAIATDPRFTYAVGFKDELGAYGMVYGPTPILQECLDFSPPADDRVCYVLEFDGGHRGGTNRIVGRWAPKSCRWMMRT